MVSVVDLADLGQRTRTPEDWPDAVGHERTRITRDVPLEEPIVRCCVEKSGCDLD